MCQKSTSLSSCLYCLSPSLCFSLCFSVSFFKILSFFHHLFVLFDHFYTSQPVLSHLSLVPCFSTFFCLVHSLCFCQHLLLSVPLSTNLFQVLQQQQQEREKQLVLQREQLAQQKSQLDQIQSLQQQLQQQLVEQRRQKTVAQSMQVRGVQNTGRWLISDVELMLKGFSF